MAGFLENLIRNKALQEKILEDDLPDADFFSTHPNTPDRVARAAAAGAPGVVRRDVLLRNVAGLVFGDDPAQGLVRGRRFSHPDLGLTFEAPPGFRLIEHPASRLCPATRTLQRSFDSMRRAATKRTPILESTSPRSGRPASGSVERRSGLRLAIYLRPRPVARVSGNSG